jgi:hypothetical protein
MLHLNCHRLSLCSARRAGALAHVVSPTPRGLAASGWMRRTTRALQRVHLDDVRSDDVRSVASAQRNGIVLQVAVEEPWAIPS